MFRLSQVVFLGHVIVVDQSAHDNGPARTFTEHDNCVSSIQFNRSKDGLELFSAGTDAQLRSWDLITGTSSNVIFLNDCFTDEGASAQEVEDSAACCVAVAQQPNVLTPPMAHSISINQSCSLLACGLENSALLLFDINNAPGQSSSKLKTSGLLSGHTAGVCQVNFPVIWQKAGIYEELIISGGSDKRIISWKSQL